MRRSPDPVWSPGFAAEGNAGLLMTIRLGLEAPPIFPRRPVLIYRREPSPKIAASCLTMQTLPLVLAQTVTPSWHSDLGGALLGTVVFALAGILLAIIGYKLFDYCTPGNLHEEIVKNRNVAAAVIGAAIILGVCIVVAAAIVG